MVDSERRDRLKQVYFAALDLSTAELEAYLAEACAQDPELANEVRSLIVAARAAGGPVIGGPAARVRGVTPAADAGPEADDRHGPVTDWERYTDLELIASGGMGDVYRAFDPRLKRHTALKFIRGASTRHVERFLREAEAQARVEHANVLEVYETGEVKGLLYIAMRFIAGPTLKETREETTVEQKVVIMRQVAEAIHAAHREGLVHRDVKPTNILIERTADGILKPWVTDFGIVADDRSPALTATGDLVGTPWYMAPERLTGDEATVDRRSDIFSLGVTLYEYLSGERPYQAGTAVELFSMIREGPPRRLRQVAPELPQDLETIVMKCLEHDPERRYASARDLADDLGRYLDGDTISARRPSLAYTTWSWVRRNRALTAVAAAAVVLVTSSAALVLQARGEARERENRARAEAELRAEVGREFNRRAEEIDNLVRLARMAPIHDTSDIEDMVTTSIRAIRRRLGETGGVGEEAGHFALGRAYLAGGDYAKAHEHLQRAVTLGYTGRAVSLAYGQALAALYQEEVQKAERKTDKAERQRARAAADATYRQPALVYFSQAEPEDAEYPELTEGIVAFLEEDYPTALAKAHEASAKLSSLYEAHKLAGNVYTEMGAESWGRGDRQEAHRRWLLALDAYARASDVARSDRDAYLGTCRLGTDLVRLEAGHDRAAMEASFRLALKACANAEKVDPNSADPKRLTSDLYYQYAMVNPDASYEQAVRYAKLALDLSPDDETRLTRGNSFLAEADARIRSRQNPTDMLNRAVEMFDQVLSDNPRSFAALSGKGRALRKRATNEATAGGDALTTLQLALAAHDAAVAIRPDDVNLIAEQAAAYSEFAQLALVQARSSAGHEAQIIARLGLEAAATARRLAPDLSPPTHAEAQLEALLGGS